MAEPKPVRNQARRLNGMNPDREMPGTQKQGVVKSIRETIQTLRGSKS